MAAVGGLPAHARAPRDIGHRRAPHPDRHDARARRVQQEIGLTVTM
jgi:hypothetical protein